MNVFKKIAGRNLIALLVYSVWIRFTSRGSTDDIIVMSAVFVGLHVMVALGMTAVEFSNRRKENGRAWAWSAGIILLVGFSTCLGNAALG